jgi:peptide deformylase
MLLPYDHELLRKKLVYTELDQALREDLHKTLIEACTKLGGVGLSANQIGIDNRVFCVRMAGYEETFFNPVVVKESDKFTLFKEGCLSQPGVYITLKRPESVMLEFTTIAGERKQALFNGITARIIQHEYDHMEGRNFLELASPLKKAMALKQAKKKAA